MRHSGDLPLAAVEHIWREIITTFTAMQAPFSVVAGPATRPLAMRDLVRFYFGFSVPVTVRLRPATQAIAEVARSGRRRSRSIAAASTADGGARLPAPTRRRVFAKLPFIEIPDGPVDLPAYVVGPPLKEAHQPDIDLLAVADAPGLQARASPRSAGASPPTAAGTLIEMPVAVDPGRYRGQSSRALRCGGSSAESARFCQPIRFLAERVACHRASLEEDPMPELRPQPRRGVLDISAYVPGDDRSGAKRSSSSRRTRRRSARARWRSRPTGQCRQAASSIRKARRAMLREAIAAAYGLNPERIVCGNGSDELLTLLAQTYLSPGDEAIYTRARIPRLPDRHPRGRRHAGRRAGDRRDRGRRCDPRAA